MAYLDPHALRAERSTDWHPGHTGGPALTNLRARVRSEEAGDLLRNLKAAGEVVADLPTVNARPDPDDNVILDMEAAGRADPIVSGDKKHRLALGRHDGIPS